MTTPYAAAWLSEMWPTVREYHDHMPTMDRPKPRLPCPICCGEYVASYLDKHVTRAHSQKAADGGEVVDRGAA